MLDTHCNRKEEAESLYRRALTEEPRHSYALYNLAVLLEERLSHENPIGNTGLTGEVSRNVLTEMLEERKREIAQLYERAVQADSRDPTTMADYGR
jgi:tetratricopeptide (TPR) repeat protein